MRESHYTDREAMIVGAHQWPNAIMMGLLGTLSGGTAWLLLHIADAMWLQHQRLNVLGIDVYFSPMRIVPGIFAGLGIEVHISPTSVIPGIVFGIMFGIVFHRHGMMGHLRQLVYLLAAGISYFIAFHVASNSFSRWGTGTEILDFALSGISAGVAGSLLLGVATTRLAHAAASTVLLTPVAVGGLAGALLTLMHYDTSEFGWCLLILFAVWQGSYAASVAAIFRRQP